MKKNRMMRLASVLLVCVLLTISVISGTFAKYTTAAEVSDSARVAKWGITLATTSDLFAKTYKDPSGNAITVKITAADNKNLVAPGTEGSGLDISISGNRKPEVSYNMAIDLDTANSKMPKLTYTPTSGSPTIYEPVKFIIYDGTTKLAEKSFSDLTTLFDGTKAIYTYDVGADKYYLDKNCDGTITTAEQAAATNNPPKINIKWNWAIDNGTGAAAKLYTKLDTILGDLAAGITIPSADYPLPAEIASIDTSTANATIFSDVKLGWTVTATQID